MPFAPVIFLTCELRPPGSGMILGEGSHHIDARFTGHAEIVGEACTQVLEGLVQEAPGQMQRAILGMLRGVR